MSVYKNTNLNQSMIYQKSLDIFKLSRHVATYITDDKDLISMHRSGNKTDNYADNLVMNAYRLVPKIVEAECEENPTLRIKYAKSIRIFIDRIYNDCLQLKTLKIDGTDFVELLQTELKKLHRIHHHYIKSM